VVDFIVQLYETFTDD